MYPAPSVILFTSLSGIGFGLLAWLGTGHPAVTYLTAFTFFFLAYGLAVGGLLASVFHLGNKINAFKAFSQWRSSWLSREGIMAVASLLVMAPYAIGEIFFGQQWPLFGWLGAAGAVTTVFTTSMIYTQMQTVPRWNSPLTPVLFLLYALGGGALLAGQTGVAMLLLIALGLVQALNWYLGDGAFAAAGHTLETATGLAGLGRMRLLEPPHSSPNYLMKEMVFVVGRKHVRKLRMISMVLLVLLPVLILLLAPAAHVLVGIAVLSHLAGVFVARWLFFAQAEHVVGLYYDMR